MMYINLDPNHQSNVYEKLTDLTRINWELLERVREVESELASQKHLTKIREMELEHWKKRALRSEGTQ